MFQLRFNLNKIQPNQSARQKHPIVHVVKSSLSSLFTLRTFTSHFSIKPWYVSSEGLE